MAKKSKKNYFLSLAVFAAILMISPIALKALAACPDDFSWEGPGRYVRCENVIHGVDEGLTRSFFCSAERLEYSYSCSDGYYRLDCTAENFWTYITWYNEYENNKYAGNTCDTDGDGVDDGDCYYNVHRWGPGSCPNGDDGGDGDGDGDGDGEEEPEYNECEVRKLSCPKQAEVNLDFTMSFEFLGTGPDDYPYERRYIFGPKYHEATTIPGCPVTIPAGIDNTYLWCSYDQDFEEAVWHSETQNVACPPEEGTYTYYAGCKGMATIDDSYCQASAAQNYDGRKSCKVKCVAALSTCSPDTNQACCDNASADVDGSATKGSAPGATCGGGSCYLAASLFPESAPPDNNSRCCGDDLNEFFISGAQSCDGTTACCDDAGDFVEGGQCVAACTPTDLPPEAPTLEPPTSFLEGSFTLDRLSQFGSDFLNLFTFNFLQE